MDTKRYFAAIAVVVMLGTRATLSNGTHAIAIPPHTQSIADTTFVIFDTETTGLSPKWHRVVEIGAVKVRNGKVIDEATWLINPQRSIPEKAQAVHGITDDMVKDKPTFDKVYPEFEKFIEGAVLVAHNARFDVSMMRAEIAGSGLPMPDNEVIDTLKLFRRWFPDSKSHQLGALADYLGVSGEGFHRATSDSEYDARILFKGIERQANMTTLSELLTDAGGAMKF